MQSGRARAAANLVNRGPTRQQRLDGRRASEPDRVMQWRDAILVGFMDVPRRAPSLRGRRGISPASFAWPCEGPLPIKEGRSCDQNCPADKQEDREKRKKWRRRGSNPQPPACKAGALPIELRPQVRAIHINSTTNPSVGRSPGLLKYKCNLCRRAKSIQGPRHRQSARALGGRSRGTVGPQQYKQC